MNFFSKIVLAVKVTYKVKNWPEYFKDHFGLLKTPTYVLTLRNGQSFVLRSGTADRGILHEVWVLNEYPFPSGIANSVVIDLGSQIGIFASYAAYNGARVFAYEPCENNYGFLVKNIKRNGWEKKIKPYNLAVSNKSRLLTLYLTENNTGGHSAIYKSKKKTTVRAVSLDDIFRKNKIKKCDFLKIDTEGSEFPILYSAPNNLWSKIGAIQMECHRVDGKTDYNIHSMKKFLEGKGFTVQTTKDLSYLYAKRLDAKKN